MKKILCFVCVCVMLMLGAVTPSAASESKFRLRLVSENDTQAVLSLDFAGGASFSAIDFNVEVNKDKLEVTKIADGKGLTNFKLQAQAAVSQPNVNSTPAMVTAAMIPGYRNVDGEDLFVITLKKLTKDAITKDDVKIRFTNCQDASFSNINPVVTYELAEGSSEEASGSSSTAPIASEPTAENEKTDNVTSASQSADGTTSSATAENAQEQEKDETADDEKGGNKTWIIVVCVILAVAVGGGAGVTYIFMKKKNERNETNKDSKEG